MALRCDRCLWFSLSLYETNSTSCVYFATSSLCFASSLLFCLLAESAIFGGYDGCGKFSQHVKQEIGISICIHQIVIGGLSLHSLFYGT